MKKGFSDENESILTTMLNEYIPHDKIVTCVDYSFERKGDLESENKILAEDKRVEQEEKLKLHPALTING